MTTFAIATDNNITAFTAAEQVPEGQDRFATEKEFAKLSADWPITRFPEVWNALRRRGALRRPEAGQEVHGPQDGGHPDLEGHPGTDARPCARGRPRRAEESQGDQGRHRQGRDAHGARGQQEGHRPRHAQAPRRRHARGHHVRYRLAGPQRPRLHLRQPGQEDGHSPSNPSSAPMATAHTARRSNQQRHPAAGLTRRRRFFSGPLPPAIPASRGHFPPASDTPQNARRCR